MKPAKIAMIGAGAVGSITAYALISSKVIKKIRPVVVNQNHLENKILYLSDVLGFFVCSNQTVLTGTNLGKG